MTDWSVFQRSEHQVVPLTDMQRNANNVLLNVLVAVGGVDDHCLRNLVALKNALLEEPDIDADRLEAELKEFAEGHDREAKVRETEAARERLARRQGMQEQFVPREAAKPYGKI